MEVTLSLRGARRIRHPLKGATLVKNGIKIPPGIARNTLVAVAMVLLFSSSGFAQDPEKAQSTSAVQPLVTQRNLSLATAKIIAEAILAACLEKGYHTAVAVVDRAGQIMVLLRDEQATAQVAEMARRKAYTARVFRITTLEFQKRTSDPAYAGQRNLPDILPLSGGAPLKVGDETVGAVGSAGSTLEQDDACAKAGISKFAEIMK
jgi:uncharacterized protein GlcG (DUF336 family)